MKSKKELSKRSGLCVILDRKFLSASGVLKVARLAIAAGADMIQLRDKESPTIEAVEIARSLVRIADRYKVPCIINDRIDVSVAAGASGVHIGQGDPSIGLVKRLFGDACLIGVSVNSLAQAMSAKRSGADYLGVGPVFQTPIKETKRSVRFGLLSKIKKTGLPVFAIGGINGKNLYKLTGRGFRHAAVIRAVCASKDPFRATKILREALA